MQIYSALVPELLVHLFSLPAPRLLPVSWELFDTNKHVPRALLGQPPLGWGRDPQDPGGERLVRAGELSGAGGARCRLLLASTRVLGSAVPQPPRRTAARRELPGPAPHPRALQPPEPPPAWHRVPPAASRRPCWLCRASLMEAPTPSSTSAHHGSLCSHSGPRPTSVGAGQTRSRELWVCRQHLPQCPRSQGQGSCSHPAALARGRDPLLTWHLRLTYFAVCHSSW